MEETPHLVAHFMASGAEKRLEDYHFLRNTHETISGQEAQLNRILRLLDEDEFSLQWRADLIPVGRARSRLPYEFDRGTNTLTLKGSIAYERLREIEHDSSRSGRRLTPSPSPRHGQELREGRQYSSEQRDLSPSSGSGASKAPSAARLRAIAEYDAALMEADAKRQRQAEENRANASKRQEVEVPERRRERLRTTFEDEQKKYEPTKERQTDDSKQSQKDESNARSSRSALADEDSSERSNRNKDKNADSLRKSSTENSDDKSSDIELTSFTVRCEPMPSSSSSSKSAKDNDSMVRLLCQWDAPSSSSGIDYYTIERQTGDQEWSPVGEKIRKSQNESQLEISSSINGENGATVPSYFRLKAHRPNGQTSTSKVTDGIFLNVSKDKAVIVPEVEILSATAVQLTWKDNEEDNNNNNNKKKNNNEKAATKYDVEKKEQVPPQQQQPEKQQSQKQQPEKQQQSSPKQEPAKQQEQQRQGNKEQGQEAKTDKQKSARQEQEDPPKKAEAQWEKVTEVPISQKSVQIDSLTDASKCEFRLIPSASTADDETEAEVEPEVLTVNNVNEWLDSLQLNPTSATTVDIDIADEGFKDFASYEIEYATADSPDQWKQMPAITRAKPHVTIDKLKQNSDYKFRFTPVPKDGAQHNDANASHLSLVMDVKTPSSRPERYAKEETKTPAAAAPVAPTPSPPQFAIQQLDSTSVLIEAVVPSNEPATFEDSYDVYSKKDAVEDDWTKVGTIDKDHLTTKVEDLEEETAYAFKVDNTTSPSADDKSNTVQELRFNPKPVKKYDTSLFLEKIEESLENMVNSVMKAAAGHQAIEEPVNLSLNDVIREVFRDEKLVPSEKFGFDTLELSNELQVYRGPKQMMLKDLEVDATADLSKHHGEIIIHNYRTGEQGRPPVIVREENGNTRVANIDGDIIIRNVVSDVTLNNEQTRHQLSMNIVGQAFLKGVQGTLVASKFKGIIVVKNVNKP